MTHVYQIVDNTNDEEHYHAGIFLSREDAIAALTAEHTPHSVASAVMHDDEFIRVSVYELAVGLDPARRLVFRRSWRREYDDDTDLYRWETTDCEYGPK